MPKPSTGTHVVAKVRQRLGWLQKELAERTGIKSRTIQEIERGSKKGLKLSHRNALRISAATGVAVDCLLDGDDWPADREIINTSGKPWSKKDAEAIERRKKDWPGAEALAVSLRAGFYDALLLDYFYLRCLLLATPDPSKALNDWRWHREKAWTQFLKEYPMAKIGKDFKWPKGLEIIKEDIDLVLAHPFPDYGHTKESGELGWSILVEGTRLSLGDKIADDFLKGLTDPRRLSTRREQDTFWGELTGPARLAQALKDPKQRRKLEQDWKKRFQVTRPAPSE